MLFYHLGSAVQDFWRLPLWLGQLSYDMSRTHSIMRVATTASPVSGMEAHIYIYIYRAWRHAHAHSKCGRE